MDEDSGTRKSLLVGGVAFAVGSLLTLQILGPEVPKPEPRFVDAREVSNVVPVAAPSAEPIAPDDTALGSDPMQTAPDTTVFDAPDIATRSDSAQVLGLAQDPANAAATAADPVEVAAPKDPEPVLSPLDQLTQAVALATAPDGGDDAEKTLTADLVAAVNNSVSEQTIDAMITDAVDEGRVSVPDAVFQVDGQIDTRALLLTLVEKAVAEGDAGAKAAVETIIAAEPVVFKAPGAPAPDLPEPAAKADTKPAYPFLAKSNAGAITEPKPKRVVDRPAYYVVRPGDSLAAIAFRFYGKTGSYQKIFDANRDQIVNPSIILIGQRLRIPS